MKLPARCTRLTGRGAYDALFAAGRRRDGHFLQLLSLPAGRGPGRAGYAMNNVLLYATSNRRHLMPRDMIENERSTAINPSEAVDEKVSLSDRFGLWLGFHRCSQDEFLAMVDGYAASMRLPIEMDALHAEHAHAHAGQILVAMEGDRTKDQGPRTKDYFPLNSGARFSRNARVPSRMSSVAAIRPCCAMMRMVRTPF